jgi:hypothetical protein
MNEGAINVHKKLEELIKLDFFKVFNFIDNLMIVIT